MWRLHDANDSFDKAGATDWVMDKTKTYKFSSNEKFDSFR